jgi:hypothetical protein
VAKNKNGQRKVSCTINTSILWDAPLGFYTNCLNALALVVSPSLRSSHEPASECSDFMLIQTAMGIKILHFSFLNMQMHKAGSFSIVCLLMQVSLGCVCCSASLLYPPLFAEMRRHSHTLVNNYLSLDYDKNKNAEASNIVVQ